MLNIARAKAPTALCADLRAIEPKVRWRAAAGLAGFRTQEAVRALGEALSDPEPFVRWAAAQALGEIGRQATDQVVPVAVGQVVLEAAEATDAGARAAAADAIASWGQRAPLEPALVLARDAEATVRAAAVRALGLAGSQSPQVVGPALRTALEDPDLEVRRMAANALAWCRDEASASALCVRLRDPVGVVRAAALRALARLSTWDPEAAVLARLRDPDPFVRVEAVRFLRLRGSRDSIAALRELDDDGALVGEVTVGALARDARGQVAQRQSWWARRLWRRRRH